MEPLVHYPHKPFLNFGTVVWFSGIGGLSDIKIGEWRRTHPAHRVFIAYGVTAQWRDGKIISLGHGDAIAVQMGERTEFYSYVCGNVDWDNFLMPWRVIQDWDEFTPSPRLHLPDLFWFYPDYRVPVNKFEQMSRSELKQRIIERVELATKDR
ncbi:MAG: hypothetical protein V7L20_05620 [Nostoc sp.]|uniref:hypothetical protein n=1 Tax=Nostoc sp. TaxID=1180 RepID=UPI002FFB2A7C